MKWRGEETITIPGEDPILIWLRGQRENTAACLTQTNAVSHVKNTGVSVDFYIK